METINVVFSSDNNYAQYMGVAICSLFENKTCPNPIDIYVLDGEINDDNKNKLAVLENRYNFKINYIKMDTEFFKDFYISRQITQASYYRIITPELFSTLDKILYLDCDIIITGDILELYNININNYFFAAVDEEKYPDNRLLNLDIPENERYFNAGVMLINLSQWRDSNTSKKIIEFIKEKKERLESHDQDAINAILWGKWLNISYKYNFTSILESIHLINYKEINKYILIIHYTGIKPWNYLYMGILKNKYSHYLKKTPWNKKKYTDKNIKSIIIKSTISVLNFIFPIYILKKLKNIKNKLKIKFY